MKPSYSARFLEKWDTVICDCFQFMLGLNTTFETFFRVDDGQARDSKQPVRDSQNVGSAWFSEVPLFGRRKLTERSQSGKKKSFNVAMAQNQGHSTKHDFRGAFDLICLFVDLVFRSLRPRKTRSVRCGAESRV